jgi:hypothetical protein
MGLCGDGGSSADGGEVVAWLLSVVEGDVVAGDPMCRDLAAAALACMQQAQF